MAWGSLVNKIVAIVAVIVSVVLAGRAVVADADPEPSSELVAAAVDGRAAVSAEPVGPVAPPPSLATPSPPTTMPAPSSEGVTPPRRPATTLPPVTTTVPVEAPPVTPPPAPPIDFGASSWSVVGDGLTVTARIEPVAPRVGDAVTIFYTVTGDGDSCCGSTVDLPASGTVLATNLPPLSPTGCPIERVTAWSTSVVVSQPGRLDFQVHGSQLEGFCTGPTGSGSATLFATFQVQPAT